MTFHYWAGGVFGGYEEANGEQRPIRLDFSLIVSPKTLLVNKFL